MKPRTVPVKFSWTLEPQIGRKSPKKRTFQDVTVSSDISEVSYAEETDSSTTDSAPEVIYEAKIQKLEGEEAQLNQTVAN